MANRFATRCTVVLAGLLAMQGAFGAPPDVSEKLTNAACEHCYRLDYDGTTFAGPAWELLLREGRAAQFFLIGEQHGIAENPLLAAALFEALTSDGYRHVAIEISPPMAAELDRVLHRDGLDGLRELFALPGGEPAFFGMREEAEFVARARAAVSGRASVLWGADYEVGGDRYLLRRLAAMKKPRAAREALAELQRSSAQSWARYAETRNPQYIFSFAGDPALVRAVRDAWPRANAEAKVLLTTLEETLAINALWSAGDGYASNLRRAALLRANFLRHWRAEQRAGRTPKVLAKFGASHMVRGLNSNGTYDLGTLLPELAAEADGHALSLLVIAGPDSEVASLNPSTWRYLPGKPRDRYAAGLEPLLQATLDDAYTLIDLRPLRGLLSGRERDALHPQLARVLFGFDMLLVMTGSTPAAEFKHPEPRS